MVQNVREGEMLDDRQAAVLARRYADAVRHGDGYGPLRGLALTGVVHDDLVVHLAVAVAAYRGSLVRYPPTEAQRTAAQRIVAELTALLRYARRQGRRGPVPGWPRAADVHRPTAGE